MQTDQIIIYQTTDGLHVKNIIQEGELDEESTTELFSVAQQEGARSVNRNIKFYNLDMILSVGYRVNSKKGTQFRIWTNKVLKEFIKKVINLLPLAFSYEV